MTCFLALSWAALLIRYSSHVDAISPPSQVAIAAGSSSDVEVSFTWLTDDARDDVASCSHVASVDFGSAGPIRTEFECLRYNYKAVAASGGPTNYTSGRIHRARFRSFAPDTSYNYSLAGDTLQLHRTFRTLPSSAHFASYPISFAAVGDLGQSVDSLDTVRTMDADPELRMILHAGDMAYADSNALRWDSYGLQVEPLSSRLQWMVCPGNHEIESDTNTGYNFVPYENRFVMPRVQPPVNTASPSQKGCEHPWPSRSHQGPDCTPSIFSGSYDWGNSFYAFDGGPARVISLNSYTDTRPGSPQHTWLKAELAALKLKRAATPWLIVQMHCPWYSTNHNHFEEKQAVDMRDLNGFEDLFFDSQVSIVLTGHVHAYERSRAVYKHTNNAKGPTYIVTGDGGNREGHSRNYRDRQLWSAYRNGTAYGHGKITLANNTHMKWEWMVDDDFKTPALSKEAAAQVADRHARAGSSSAIGPSGWHSPLPARSSEDSAWIVNPWSASTPAEAQTIV